AGHAAGAGGQGQGQGGERQQPPRFPGGGSRLHGVSPEARATGIGGRSGRTARGARKDYRLGVPPVSASRDVRVVRLPVAAATKNTLRAASAPPTYFQGLPLVLSQLGRRKDARASCE